MPNYDFANRYLYGSGVFLAGIACSTVSKQPAACPRIVSFFQRFRCLDLAAARKIGDGSDKMGEQEL